MNSFIYSFTEYLFYIENLQCTRILRNTTVIYIYIYIKMKNQIFSHPIIANILLVEIYENWLLTSLVIPQMVLDTSNCKTSPVPISRIVSSPQKLLFWIIPFCLLTSTSFMLHQDFRTYKTLMCPFFTLSLSLLYFCLYTG